MACFTLTGMPDWSNKRMTLLGVASVKTDGLVAVDFVEVRECQFGPGSYSLLFSRFNCPFRGPRRYRETPKPVAPSTPQGVPCSPFFGPESSSRLTPLLGIRPH